MSELLLAEFLFTPRLYKRSRFPLRVLIGLAVCFAAAFLFPIFPEVSYTAWYCAIMFLVLFAVSVGALALMYQGSFKDIVFCAIAGYTVQHISQEVYELLNVWLGLNGRLASDFYGSSVISASGALQWFVFLVYGWIYAVVYFAAYQLFASRVGDKEEVRIKNLYMIIVALIIVMVDVIFSSLVTYAIPDDTSLLPVVITHLYNIVCCILVLLLLFELPKRFGAEKELAVERQIRYREKQQYFTAKENIDLINLKCHDLKHQIRRIAGGKKSDDVIDEIENVISVYDAAYKTGSDALDVILTEKSLLCRKLSVKLSCIADGSCLDFMKDTDIYALFGNMLDNAIEAVCKFEEDKRVIGISVSSHNAFVIINIRNNYNGKIAFDRDLPVTGKKDRDYHGYGMKSIKYVVKKYGGEMTINTDNRIFNLNIAFSR